MLAADLEIALNGLWDAAPRLGDRIAVVGGRTIGCLVAWLAARIPGCMVELAGDEAIVVELSWFGDRLVTLPLGAAFHPRRLALRSSQVNGLPPAQRPRWTHRRRLEVRLALLAKPGLEAVETEAT